MDKHMLEMGKGVWYAWAKLSQTWGRFHIKNLVMLLFFICVISCSSTKRSQSEFLKNQKGRRCSSVISWVSYYWQIDSLANNGYRKLARYYLEDCKIDTVSYEWLLDMLGKPKEIRETDEELIVSYYYFDSKNHQSYPVKGFDTIGFVFDKQNKLLRRIGLGTGEY